VTRGLPLDRAVPTDPIERVTFRALARAFVVASATLEGPGVRFGTRGTLSYGATELDLAGLNRIATGDADRVPDDRDIEAVLAEVAHAPTMTWWIPPGPAAAAIEATIAERGFVDDPDDDSAPAMWASLDKLSEPALAPGVTIERAVSVAAVREATLLAGEGFGISAAIGAGMADLFTRIADKPASASRAFVARLDGRPVASAVAVVDGDAVVIYNVATLPDARGRGIGGAITLAALLDARARGASLGVLESSEMGYSVYRRLGFQEAGRYRILARSRPSPEQT